MSSVAHAPTWRVRHALPTNGGRRASGHPEGPAAAEHTVSVVIPAKNEAANIGWVLNRLPANLHEVILVDASEDSTVEAARSARPDVIVVEDPGCGKGAALRAGFAAATGDFIVMLDADGSMDPGEIGRFIAPLVDGYEMVKGSRCMEGGGSVDLSPLRRAGNQALVSLLNLLYGVWFTDLCYGFFAFRRDCLPTLSVCATGFEIETELVVCAVRSDLRTTEVPSFEEARRHGESNLQTFSDGTRVLRTLLSKRLAPRPLPRRRSQARPGLAQGHRMPRLAFLPGARDSQAA